MVGETDIKPEEPVTPDVPSEPKKEEPKKETPKKTKIVTKKQEVKVANTKKEEIEEEFIEVAFIDEMESNLKNINYDFNFVSNGDKYVGKYAMIGVFSSLSIGLFIVKKSVFK